MMIFFVIVFLVAFELKIVYFYRKNWDMEEIKQKTIFKNSAEVLDHYGLDFDYQEFINYDEITPVDIPDHFLKDLKFSLSNRGKDDKEFYGSEFLIVPFLKEAWKLHPKVFLFSHPYLQVNDFTLYPDYVVTARSRSGIKIFQKPILMTVEAKDEQVEKGWFDALLQMVAARELNSTDRVPIQAIVTTADFWYFGKLENQSFIRHPFPVGITDPELLLGVLSYLFGKCEEYAELLK
ncbi:MAG: hypothetical protein AAF849_03185 [Bacteroidota bacterium]